jgi:hypothetical protein
MAISARDPLNQRDLYEKAESLNKAFDENGPVKLADFNKQIRTLNRLDIASSVYGVFSAANACFLNPWSAALGALCAGGMRVCIGATRVIDSSPKFTIHNGQIFQENPKYQKELDQSINKKLGSVFLRTAALAATNISISDVYEKGCRDPMFPALGVGSNIISFYLGFSGANNLYRLVQRLI